MTTIDLLENRLLALETRVRELESIAAIERLQRIYGYYLDNRMWGETVALFTDDGEVEVGRRGIYRGRDHGSWRIRVLRWAPSFYGVLPEQAIAAGRPSAPVSEKFPPSAPPTYGQDDTGSFILPFHYPHPHTGERTPIG